MKYVFSRLQIKQMRQTKLEEYFNKQVSQKRKTMNMLTEKSDDNNYSRNFKYLSFALFPFYDSYHGLCCVTLITSNASQIVGVC